MAQTTPPKPPGQRRRRNADAPKWRSLPAEGRTDPAPPLPSEREWLPATVEWWEEIWSSPMALLWLPADMAALHRLAKIVDAEKRGEAGTELMRIAVTLEDRLGLSAKSRRMLQWEVSQAQKARSDPEPESPAPPPSSERQRLRAV